MLYKTRGTHAQTAVVLYSGAWQRNRPNASGKKGSHAQQLQQEKQVTCGCCLLFLVAYGLMSLQRPYHL